MIRVSVSLPEVFREEGRIPGAGGGPRGGKSSEEPANRLRVAAAGEPSCSLAAHHRRHHHDVLPALRPQCGKMQLSYTLAGFTVHGSGDPVLSFISSSDTDCNC